MQNIHVAGETNLPINSPLIENIEPDDENKSKQSKQIEALHLGRVRKKSGIKTAGGSRAQNYH